MVFWPFRVWFLGDIWFGFFASLRLVFLRVCVWFVGEFAFVVFAGSRLFFCDFKFGFFATLRLFVLRVRVWFCCGSLLVFCEFPFGLFVNWSLCFWRICVWLFGEFPTDFWGNQRVVFEHVAFSCYEFAHAVCFLRNWACLLLLFPIRFSP